VVRRKTFVSLIIKVVTFCCSIFDSILSSQTKKNGLGSHIVLKEKTRNEKGFTISGTSIERLAMVTATSLLFTPKEVVGNWIKKHSFNGD